MRNKSLLTTAVLLLCLAVPGEVARAQTSTGQSAALQPGDHVRITVLSDDKNLSGEFVVAPDSTLKHPLYNQVKVVGVPVDMLKERFASFLRKLQREPQLEVEPLFKVTVSGEVRSANIYLLPPETTVADAVARAGGATDRGDLDRVTVMRDRRKLSFSLGENASNSRSSTIESGDQITVPAQRNVFSSITRFTPVIGVAVSIVSVIILSKR